MTAKPSCVRCGKPYSAHNIGAITTCPIIATYLPTTSLDVSGVLEGLVGALNRTMAPDYWDGTWEQAIAHAQNSVVDTFAALNSSPLYGREGE